MGQQRLVATYLGFQPGLASFSKRPVATQVASVNGLSDIVEFSANGKGTIEWKVCHDATFRTNVLDSTLARALIGLNAREGVPGSAPLQVSSQAILKQFDLLPVTAMG
jgi:hypothetical protein